VLPLFFPLRPIAEGEQLTINYGDDYWSGMTRLSLEDYDFDEELPGFDE
jgi:hypothetical protein